MMRDELFDLDLAEPGRDPRLGRRSFLTAALGCASLGFAGGRAEAAAQPNVLKVVAPVNPSSLDPVTGGSGLDHAYLYALYDTLISWDFETLKPVPGLARAWTFLDPLTLVLDLRPNVTFHDGTPFDAEAVRFNLERCRSDPRSNVKADVGSIKSVATRGDDQVVITLSKPDTAIPLILSERPGMMASPTAVKRLGREHDRRPVGSGAFSFVSWHDNESVRVVRYDAYWKGPHALDGIDFSVITEVNTGLRTVTTRQNDFIYALFPLQKRILDRVGTLKEFTGPTLQLHMLYLNYGRGPLKDPRVRRALNHAIDRPKLNLATMSGLGEVAASVLPQTHWAYDGAAAGHYRHDPAEARRLLAEAGYADGVDLDCRGTTDQVTVQRQEVLMQQLTAVGFRPKFTNGSRFETGSGFFVEKRGDLMLSSWTGRPDPSHAFDLLFGASSYFNPGRVTVPGLPEAVAASRSSTDLDERKKALSDVQRIVAEQGLFVPLVFQAELDGAVPRVKGYRPNLLGKPKFDGVSLQP